MRFLAVLALILAGCLVAYAQSTPLPLNRPEQLARAGECAWGHRTVVSTFTRPVRTSTGVTSSAWDRAYLFPYGALVNISCDDDAYFTWAQEDVANANAIVTSTTGYITDLDTASGFTEGTRGTFKVEGGSYRDNVPFRSFFQGREDSGAISKRTKACTTNDTNVYPKIAGFPCDTDTDCIYSGVTCSASLEPQGAFLLSVAANATNCYVCIEQ